MKTFANYLYGIALMLTLSVSLTSCESDDPDLYEQTDYLCSRHWADEWVEDGVRYYQEFTFYTNYTGQEYFYREDLLTGNRSESNYSFDWDWDGYYTIYMRYADGPSYMEGISMGGNELRCTLDGEQVTFRGI